MFTVKQPGLSGFSYDFFDAKNKKIGTLRYPDVAVATNARLKDAYPQFLNKTIEITYQGENFEIEFEYMNMAWVNDIEFRFKAKVGALALAREIHAKNLGSKRSAIQIKMPFDAELVNKSTWLGVCYDLEQDGVKLGSVAEKGLFSVKRQVTLDFPDSVAVPVQFFLFFLVCNRSFR